jgi:hypothetical protein
LTVALPLLVVHSQFCDDIFLIPDLLLELDVKLSPAHKLFSTFADLDFFLLSPLLFLLLGPFQLINQLLV